MYLRELIFKATYAIVKNNNIVYFKFKSLCSSPAALQFQCIVMHNIIAEKYSLDSILVYK